MRFGNFIKTASTYTTSDQIDSAETMYRYVMIQADPSNSGELYVGNASMVTGTGQYLSASVPMVINHVDDRINLSELYISGQDGDFVRVFTVGGG